MACSIHPSAWAVIGILVLSGNRGLRAADDTSGAPAAIPAAATPAPGSSASPAPATTSSTPPPARRPRPPVRLNPGAMPGAPVQLPEINDQINVDLPNFDVREMLRFYGLLTRKHVVLDSTIHGQITLRSEGKVSQSTLIALIEDTLLLNGFVLVDRGSGEVIVLGLSKNARGAGIPVFTKLEDLPTGARVVSFVFLLRHRDPTDVQHLFQRYVTANLYTSFVADPTSKTLLVTENAAVIRGLAVYLKEIDVPTPAIPPTDAPIATKPAKR